MTYRDSNVGSCDHCLDTDAFIVGNDSDGNFCDKCDDFDQSAAFASIHEEQAKRLAYKQLTMQVAAFLIGTIFGGVVIGTLADFGLTIATAVYGGGSR